MTYYKITEHQLVGFRKSKTKHKKYDAILENKKNKKAVYVPFGDSRYQQFKDATGLGLYSHKDHGDRKRRSLYRARHKGFLKKGYYSPGHFSYFYLW